jgi:hypothetical protein
MSVIIVICVIASPRYSDDMRSKLNPLARNVAQKLFRAFPQFRTGQIIREDGELEAGLPAPEGSHAGHLVVFTNAGDLWVRLALPYAFYGVDDTRELIKIINGVLADDIFFVVVTARRKWLETTLVGREVSVKLDSTNGSVMVISWSGQHDRQFRLKRQAATKPRKK